LTEARRRRSPPELLRLNHGDEINKNVGDFAAFSLEIKGKRWETCLKYIKIVNMTKSGVLRKRAKSHLSGNKRYTTDPNCDVVASFPRTG
jgi:hypothetical protein